MQFITRKEHLLMNTRYEEYFGFKSKLPFTLYVGLERTPENCSNEANWHENLEIQVCEEGEGTVLLDGEKHHFLTNDIVVVNSNVIHHTGTENNLKYSCLIIDTKFCEQADIDHTAFLFEPHFKSKTFIDLLNNLQTIYSNNKDICRVAKSKEIVLKILIELCEHHISKVNKPMQKKSLETVRQTINYIRQNCNRTLSLDEISKNVLMDKYSISREFKKITAQTIFQYINNYRCKRAAELILSGKTVQEAAFMCGFHNMSYFTKVFKQYMRELPSKYKK